MNQLDLLKKENIKLMNTIQLIKEYCEKSSITIKSDYFCNILKIIEKNS